MKKFPEGIGNGYGYENMGNGFFNYTTNSIINKKYSYRAPTIVGFNYAGNGYHSYPYNLLIRENSK